MDELIPCRRLAATIVGQGICDALAGSTEAHEWLKSDQADQLMLWVGIDAPALLSRMKWLPRWKRALWRDDWRMRSREPRQKIEPEHRRNRRRQMRAAKVTRYKARFETLDVG
jgi:hypothetical protein